MPIPYHDQDDIEELGAAAFLKVEAKPDHSGYRGALFQINVRGEPLEFTYNHVETPNSFLWRSRDIRRSALKSLTTSLLTACSAVPRMIVCLAGEVPSSLFCQDIRVSVPVCRVASAQDSADHSPLEETEVLPESTPGHLLWFPSPPAESSLERLLTRELVKRGLLWEPFDRAGIGLREVYGEVDPVQA